MSSKLFHTVVAFGITLGAASVGCSAEPVDAPASSESAVATSEPAPVVEKDRFCEVAWPTTKGGPRPDFSCVDPAGACGAYPGGEFGFFGGADTCWDVAPDGLTCASTSEVWLFCKKTDTSHAWSCPAGMKKTSECVWPAPDNSGNTTKEPPPQGNGAYGG